MLGVDEDDELIDPMQVKEGDETQYQGLPSFEQMVLENLHMAGVQQAHKQDRIDFTSLTGWPGHFICAEGRYREGDAEKRAGIFIGPEFGTVSRPDLVESAREAGDAGFDVLIACAFNYEAHASEFDKLGRIPVLKARMNADLHMADDLKNTGAGNLFVIFGEPDIDVLEEEDDTLRVKVKGVDVFDPSTGEVRSDDADGIACWFVDNNYNGESFFVRQAYFLGANDPYKSLKTTLKTEIDEDAWATLNSDTSRPFARPSTGRIAVKVINHLGDEVMKVFRTYYGNRSISLVSYYYSRSYCDVSIYCDRTHVCSTISGFGNSIVRFGPLRRRGRWSGRGTAGCVPYVRGSACHFGSSPIAPGCRRPPPRRRNGTRRVRRSSSIRFGSSRKPWSATSSTRSCHATLCRRSSAGRRDESRPHAWRASPSRWSWRRRASRRPSATGRSSAWPRTSWGTAGGIFGMFGPEPDGATPVDADEAEDLVPAHIRTRAELNEWEQANILRAAQWVERTNAKPLDEGTIRGLHRRMFDRTWKWAGQYRTSDKNIGVYWAEIPVQLRNFVEDGRFWLREGTYAPDEAGVRLHHRLVLIHPFPNGNGRHARLWCDLLMRRLERPPLNWRSRDLDGAGAARAAYIGALRSADGGDFQPLFDLLLRDRPA